MKLYEYEAAELLARHGIPTPRFGVARSPSEARGIATEIGGRVVLKAQVLVGGRGKAGGIKLAGSPEEAEEIARSMLGSEVRGEKVRSLMVAEAVDVADELYLSIVLDRSEGVPLMLISREGGVEIEEMIALRPDDLGKIKIDPLVGLLDYQLRYASQFLGLEATKARGFAELARNLYTIYQAYGCELVEINPLAVTYDGSLKALDAKMVIDDNALRKSSLNIRREEVRTLESEAREMGFTYVELDGCIGIVGNGAGLTMATMDMVKLYGGEPANFLDIGGGANAELVYRAASLLLKRGSVKVLFVNVLGGITRCDEVARGLVRAMKEHGGGRRLVVRLVGTREEEGQRILTENGYEYLESMEEAARKAVELSRVA